MKYLKPILVFFLITGFITYSFTQILQFEKRFESPANRITSLVETDDQALMILCELEGNDSVYVDSSYGYSHINHTLLYKVTLEGDTIWSKVFINYKMDNEYFTEIIKTTDGDFLLLDCFEDSIHLFKIDTNGDSIWSKSVEAPVHYLSVLKAIEFSNNDILILCSWNGNRHGYFNDPTSLLIKFNQSGDKIWERSISEMRARDMLITEDNKILLLVKEIMGPIRISIYDLPIIDKAPSPSIVLQSYDFDGNFIGDLSYSFVWCNFSNMAMNSQQELFISGGIEGGGILPVNIDLKAGSFLMKTDEQRRDLWTRYYNYSYISSVWLLPTSNVLTVSWPYLRTINNKGDSINGYQFNYELKNKQEHLVLISGNDLYQTGILKNGDSLVLSKINLGLISDGNYKPPDPFTQSIDVYPNPASGYVTIDLSWIRESDLVSIIYPDDFRVFVYDVNGRQIKEADLGFVNNELRVTVNDLADGLYYFNIHLSSGEVITKKIVVAR